MAITTRLGAEANNPSHSIAQFFGRFQMSHFAAKLFAPSAIPFLAGSTPFARWLAPAATESEGEDWGVEVPYLSFFTEPNEAPPALDLAA